MPHSNEIAVSPKQFVNFGSIWLHVSPHGLKYFSFLVRALAILNVELANDALRYDKDQIMPSLQSWLDTHSLVEPHDAFMKDNATAPFATFGTYPDSASVLIGNLTSVQE